MARKDLLKSRFNMRVISIDPGYERLGIAIVEKNGPREDLVFSDCLQTSAKEEHFMRLLKIGQGIEKIICDYKPEAMAMETLFFKNNQKTAMCVSEARGVALYQAAKAGLSIAEFTPLQIKMAITGYGKSDKTQVMQMVKRLIKINKNIKYDDEYDAIAVGLTYFATIRKM